MEYFLPLHFLFAIQMIFNVIYSIRYQLQGVAVCPQFIMTTVHAPATVHTFFLYQSADKPDE